MFDSLCVWKKWRTSVAMAGYVWGSACGEVP